MTLEQSYNLFQRPGEDPGPYPVSGSDTPCFGSAQTPGRTTSPFHYTDTARKQSLDLDRAIYLAGELGKLSPAYFKHARNQERAFDVQDLHAAIARGESPIARETLKKHQEDLLAALPGFQERRQTELALADRLSDAADRAESELCDWQTAQMIRRDVDKMRQCRQGGYSGIDQATGARRQIWDEKCGKVRLCPDESRAETQRMVERYVPFIHSWLTETRGRRRAFYCVFTEPNFRPGDLAREKKGQLERFKAKIMKGRQAVSEADRERHGWTGNKRWRDLFPTIKGSLVIQEDPLSAGLDWNVHLNVILLVDGAIDFTDIRQAWGFNVEIRELDLDVKNLTSTFLEIIKYSAAFTTDKSQAKAKSGQSLAPGMLDWPWLRLLEWYKAQQGFRRTRSYGCLYRLPQAEEEDLDDTATTWISRVEWTARGHYIVDLILENNFLTVGDAKAQLLHQSTGPPGPRSRE